MKVKEKKYKVTADVPFHENGSDEAKQAGYTHIQVELYYSLGGMNYFSGKSEPRGYYLSITPVNIKQEDGYAMVGYTMFSGIKFLIEEATRKGQKKFQELDKRVRPKMELIANTYHENGGKDNLIPVRILIGDLQTERVVA